MGLFIGISLAIKAAAATAASVASSVLVGTAGVGGAAGSTGLIGAEGAVTGSGLMAGAGLGLGIYGQMATGQAMKQQAAGQKSIAEYSARVAERDAEAIRQKSIFDQKRQAKRAARIKSSQTAALAHAGGLGSPVAGDLAAEQSAELELENLLIGYEGQVGAQRQLSQAAIDRASGKIAMQKGSSYATAGYIGAGSSLLSGFGDMNWGSTPKKKTLNRQTNKIPGYRDIPGRAGA